MSDEISMTLRKWMDECTKHETNYYIGRHDALIEFKVKLEKLLMEI